MIRLRLSKTRSECIEKLYPLEKTTIVFLDPPKKMYVTFVGYSWNIQGKFLYSIFPEHYFGNFPQNFIGNFFQIFREYIMGMFHEYSTNIYLLGGFNIAINLKYDGHQRGPFHLQINLLKVVVLICYKMGN